MVLLIVSLSVITKHSSTSVGNSFMTCIIKNFIIFIKIKGYFTLAFKNFNFSNKNVIWVSSIVYKVNVTRNRQVYRSIAIYGRNVTLNRFQFFFSLLFKVFLISPIITRDRMYQNRKSHRRICNNIIETYNRYKWLSISEWLSCIYYKLLYR